MRRLKGVGVSPGLAIGRAVLLRQHPLVIRFSIRDERVEGEMRRLDEARARSAKQLGEIKERVSTRVGAELARLFDAQLLMLHDAMLIDRAKAIVAGERVNAEWAVQRAYEELAAIFDGMEDPYLRDRKGDVADVVGRLRMNLSRGRTEVRDLFRDIEEDSILVADELMPSMAAQVDWRRIRGFVSDMGSRTYHTAIVARSLHVPTVVGLDTATQVIPPGALVVIDGTHGEVLVDPTPAALSDIRARWEGWNRDEEAARSHRAEPAITSDGVRITLQANVELPDDLAAARQNGAEGVGLYRSEFLAAASPVDAVSEESHYRTYREMLEQAGGQPVTVRTFDLDEDQLLSWPRTAEAADAAASARSRGPLGLRAIRLSLARRELFGTQLRALLRAARHGPLSVLFPFVSSIEELREARAALAQAAADLAARGETVGELPVGVMIEIPSAAVTVDLFAREVDFLSVGTNDLIQYALAVDRTDARVSRLYEPLHPAILRIIRHILRAAARRRVPVSLCGEMAADPFVLPLLLGLGLTRFSMSPDAIPAAKNVVRQVSVADMQRVAARVLRLSTVREIVDYLTEALGHLGRTYRRNGTANGANGTNGASSPLPPPGATPAER